MAGGGRRDARRRRRRQLPALAPDWKSWLCSLLCAHARYNPKHTRAHHYCLSLSLSTSTTTMGASQQLHQAANKIHKVERLTHAIQHPVQHGSNSVRWRIRRAIHGVVDRFLRCCCCGAL